MAITSGAAKEALTEITVLPMSSPEPDLQRGRKRRRDLFGIDPGRATIPSGESATFRGRCRHRSVSRYLDMSSLSRPTSQRPILAGAHHYHHHRNTSGSPSPSRRKMTRITRLATSRPRSLSPSRSGSPFAAYTAGLGTSQYMTTKRRRQRTQSRSRAHTGRPVGFGVAGPRSNGDEEITITAVEALVLPLATYEIAVVPNEASIDEDKDRQR